MKERAPCGKRSWACRRCILSVVHQLIGRFTGTLVTADGRPIAVRDAIGWAEEHVARW